MSLHAIVEDHAHRIEALAWAGLAAGTTAMLTGAQALLNHLAPPHAVAFAAMTPESLTQWITAIASGVGTISAAVNGVALIVRRWNRPARKARKPRKPRAPRATPQEPAA